MNSQYKWALAIFVAAIALAAILIWSRPAPEQVERVQQAPLVETVTLKITSGSIPIIVSGTVQPRDEVVIGAEVSGRLTYVNPAFREGGFVSANALLVTIDRADYLNQVRIAKADVAAQDVAVLEAQEEMAIASDDLERYSQRETEQHSAKIDLNNTNPSSRILPPSTLGQSEVDPQSTTNRKPSELASGLATREPQLRSAQAARERAAASLADAQLALRRTRISTPFGGLVSEESASIGTFVQVGQALGSVVSTRSYEVRLSLTQDDAALIPGLLEGSTSSIPVEVFYNYGGLRYRWAASVDRADANLDSTTRNIEIFLKVTNPLNGGSLDDNGSFDSITEAPPLLLGAFVEAQISGTSLDSYAVIPTSALRPGNEIWVVRDDKLVILPVRVIQRSDKVAYVTTPSLKQGGRLVTSSLTAPTNNMPVRTADRTTK